MAIFWLVQIFGIVISVEEEQGNALCWASGERTYEKCCNPTSDIDTAQCWGNAWYTEDFCCHNLHHDTQECWMGIEQRATAKLGKLKDLLNSAGGVTGLHVTDAQRNELEFDVQLYESLLVSPPLLWMFACSSPTNPLLWSKDCQCCVPEEVVCEVGEEKRGEVGGRAIEGIRQEYWQCCYPTYMRKVREEVPDAKLDAVVQAHIGTQIIQQAVITAHGQSLIYSDHCDTLECRRAHGCVVSIRDGNMMACEDKHACPEFDCSYLRAFLQTLVIIQGINPLPNLDLVLNAADLVMSRKVSFPVFARTGTHWSNTIVLPFEWQLSPRQCQKQVNDAANMGMAVPWEGRKSVLLWRGSNSNCHLGSCNIARADDGMDAMEGCGLIPPGDVRDCTWNMSTWLLMPRGRLLWLSRAHPAIDAKLVRSHLPHGYKPLTPDLENFLENEGLIGRSMPMNEQARYKYGIAIEGDSAPDRLYWQLFTGSTLLIPNGPWRVFAIFDLLEPYVHYVPVRYDLADLVEKVVWLQQHDDQARTIAQNARSFAQKYLTCEGIVYFVDRLLRAYADRLE